MDFTGNQTVQGPKDSFSENCTKGFKRFQTVNSSQFTFELFYSHNEGERSRCG